MARYALRGYVKVEFKDADEAVGEWLWVRVESCDDARQIVFGTLDNEPARSLSPSRNRPTEGQ